ncbi:MAG: TIGR04282 family arsenosugar biosynthesis glycosyltransferase, partial [Gammaproteobacteria bacterium]
MKNIRTVIFAKAPQAGFAKTRLIPVLGADGAAMLARRMLDHAVEQAIQADIGTVELSMTPIDDAVWQDVTIPDGVICTDQGEGDLGTRLARVTERVTANGEAVILTGTDCPALESRRLREIATLLAQKDAVMIPTADGGYAAFGLIQFHPTLFTDINWGTDSVAYETLFRAARLGLAVHMLPMLRDIDESEDLKWLPANWP